MDPSKSSHQHKIPTKPEDNYHSHSYSKLISERNVLSPTVTSKAGKPPPLIQIGKAPAHRQISNGSENSNLEIENVKERFQAPA